MKKIKYEANLMYLRTNKLGNMFPYGSLIPSLLMVLSAIAMKRAVYEELGGEQ